MLATNPELVLWGALLVLYGADSFTLLYYNELLLEESAGAFSARVDHSRVELRGKRLRVLNPLSPHVLSYRIPWGTRSWLNASGDADESRIRACSKALRHPRWLGVALGVNLFAVFPALSFSIGFESAFVLCAGAGYGLLLCAIGVILARRRSIPVPVADLASLLLACCLCLPLGVGLCRRISLLMDVPSDAAAILPRLLDAQALASAAEGIVTLAREEIALGVGETAEGRLRDYVARAFSR